MRVDTNLINAGQAFLRLLASRGVSYLFVNSGTDFPSIVEALACAGDEGFDVPRTMLLPHENVAVGMAYGVTMVTGQPQAVMVHVNVGTANALCGLINAARENIPMLMAAGRTPWLEKGSPASRSLNIHWAQEMFDQAGMVREHVKWDYELRSGTQMESVLDRALAIARSHPQGPVYLTLPREVMDQPTPMPQDYSTQVPVACASPDLQEVARMAKLMARAQRPLIITSRCGQEPEAVALLAELAERWAWPVVEFRPRYLSLPSSHPMHGGYEVQPWLAQADAVLVLDCDVPWIPSQCEPDAKAAIMHLGSDPLYARYPTRGFRADHSVQARPAAFLRAFSQAMAHEVADPATMQQRRLQAAEMAGARRRHLQQLIESGQARQPMGMAAVSHALGRALSAQPAKAMVINEYSLVAAALQLEEPGSYFGSSPVGGLGWGVPAALGAKLARPDAMVVAAVGDGSYLFSNPIACHHAAAMHGLPILTLVMNNGGYGAVERATVAMYPQGRAVADGMSLVSLQPMPHFEEVVRACGGWGERVDRYDDLPGALERAIHEVQHEGRQALLNVICS